jgi:hypothetical protein
MVVLRHIKLKKELCILNYKIKEFLALKLINHVTIIFKFFPPSEVEKHIGKLEGL